MQDIFHQQHLEVGCQGNLNRTSTSCTGDNLDSQHGHCREGHGDLEFFAVWKVEVEVEGKCIQKDPERSFCEKD